jgi:hypothetical protein
MHDGDALHRGGEYNRGTGGGQTARPGLHGGCRVTGIPTVELSARPLPACHLHRQGGRRPGEVDIPRAAQPGGGGAEAPAAEADGETGGGGGGAAAESCPRGGGARGAGGRGAGSAGPSGTGRQSAAEAAGARGGRRRGPAAGPRPGGGRRAGQLPGRMPQLTTACKRRPIAYAPPSLRPLGAPEAERSVSCNLLRYRLHCIHDNRIQTQGS